MHTALFPRRHQFLAALALSTVLAGACSQATSTNPLPETNVADKALATETVAVTVNPNDRAMPNADAADQKTDPKAAPKAEATDTTSTIPVEGMVCGGCEQSIQAAVGKINGVKSCKANHKDKNAVVVYDAKVAKLDDILKAIKDTGYTPSAPAAPQK